MNPFTYPVRARFRRHAPQGYQNAESNEDGTIVAVTAAARLLVRRLGLDSLEHTEYRQLWIGIVALAKQYDPSLYAKLLGYPDELPNLATLRPPGGNARPAGLTFSYFAQRQRGTLSVRDVLTVYRIGQYGAAAEPEALSGV